VNHTMGDGIIVGLAVFILGIETDWGDCFLFQQYFNICISYDMILYVHVYIYNIYIYVCMYMVLYVH
jgi:hypothetical protein